MMCSCLDNHLFARELVVILFASSSGPERRTWDTMDVGMLFLFVNFKACMKGAQ
jgi:hypothetical protein